MSLAESLEGLADVAAKAAPVIAAANPIAGVAAGIVAAALKAGAGFSAAGKDPIVEITRVLSSDPAIAEVLGERGSLLDAKFGPRK